LAPIGKEVTEQEIEDYPYENKFEEILEEFQFPSNPESSIMRFPGVAYRRVPGTAL
jgi:hypothetical protein